MRIRAFVVFAAFLAAPATALANPADGPYGGRPDADPVSKVTFDVSRGRLRDLNVSHVQFQCRRRGDGRKNPPALDGALPITDGAFRGRLAHASPTRTFAATIGGHLLERGGARGWLRYTITFPNGDRCTAVPAPIEWTARNRDLRFTSGFQSPVTVQPPVAVHGNWRFPITGADRGYSWESDLPGRVQNAFFPIVPASEPIDSYAATTIDHVTGPFKTPTRALFQEVLQDGEFYPRQHVRNQFPLINPGRRGSVSYWIRLQPNLKKLMPRGKKAWRFLMELRGSWRHPSDYRMSVGLLRRKSGPIMWDISGRRLLPSYRPEWTILKTRPAVPIGKWFQLRMSWLISPRRGYLRVHVNGTPIADYEGATRLDEPIDSMQIFKVYTGPRSLSHGPAYQWIDNVEIRRGLLSPPAQRQPAQLRH